MEDLRKARALADQASPRTSDARQSLWAGPQARAHGARQPALAQAGDGAAGPSSVARHNLITLLRLASLDANLDRLHQSMVGLLEAVEQKRSDLATLGELIEKDLTRCAGQESEAILEAASPSAVPCSGCLRLLYDRGWVERGFLPPAPRQVTRAKA